ncbi:MAG: 4-(cytidine 5'-diphospho)-2-C-methyl-D-erythritol kinase [Gammaproteobacteria bacterium]|nr:4-(cytidine 5'-diphospho)-2-C-methyl-D-erythritol kinase [Gammaproteobacteria bacterium]MCI0590062.1 4-(cytidine 5'-diphospho)-2-C-methyl-D-erythritol kinase [Gammaproteobacteria bacterium]
MTGSVWPAPAKVNLFLHVIGQRADGFHLLQTVFQFLGREDKIWFTVRRDGVVRRTSEVDGIPPEDDLVVRAAQRLQFLSGTSLGADIKLHKRLPVGGGLGGGSSDAATTLVALNQLWALGLSRQTLTDIGLSLGADVPVFIYGRSAWAEGVGEKLTPVILDEPWYLVVQPPCYVSTAEIFKAPDLTRNTPPIKIRDFLAGGGRNDCEAVVRARYPEVAQLLDWLGSRVEARVTGTGGCVFARFESERMAEEMLRELPNRWKGFVAKGMNRSPLLDRMDDEA